jgi:hypothetical protein
MTTSQVTRSGQDMLIRLGRHHVPVPGPLAAAIAIAIAQLINDGRSHRGVASPQHSTWLFPALLDLAAKLPAAGLADILGLHHNTAARWMHQAGGDWSRYAAELARRPHQT